jgi:hypothetical protein
MCRYVYYSTDAYNEMRLLLSKMRYDAVHSKVLPSYAMSIPTAQQQQPQQQQQQQQQQHSAATQQERDAHFKASLASFDKMIAAADTMRRIDCSTPAGVAQKQAALQQLQQMQAPLLAQCASALGLSQAQQSQSNGAASMLANIAATTGTAVAAVNATVAAATAYNTATNTSTGSTSKKRQLPQLPLPYSNQSVNRGSKSAKYGATTTNNSNNSMSQSSNAGKPNNTNNRIRSKILFFCL